MKSWLLIEKLGVVVIQFRYKFWTLSIEMIKKLEAVIIWFFSKNVENIMDREKNKC